MNAPKHTIPVLHMELRPRVTQEEFAKAWTHLQEHLINEMDAGEPEGRAVLGAVDTWLADTLVILALVEPPGRRAGISDIWDPLTASWRPTPSLPELMMRERLPGDWIAVSASGYQAALDEQNATFHALRRAQSVAEGLWNIINQIAMLVDDSERIEQGSRLHRELLQLVTDRLGLLRMPAGEIISEGDWTASGMARAMRRAEFDRVHDDLAELGRLREQVAAYQRHSKALADYIVEHHQSPAVDDEAVAILDGYHVGLTAVAGPAAGGENTLAAAVRLLKLAAKRGAFMAFARTADDTIGEDQLRQGSALFWVVDEFNDNEGETFGIVIPVTPDVDAALERWARSFDAIAAGEEERQTYADPFDVELGRGDSLTFRQHVTGSALEAIADVADNSYSARLRILKPEGIELLLRAIADLPAGASLSLYKGTLSTCYADERAGQPAELADLWSMSDTDMFEDDGLEDE